MVKKVLTVMTLTFLLIYSAWASAPMTTAPLETTSVVTPAPLTVVAVTPSPLEEDTATLMNASLGSNITAPPKTTPSPEQETAIPMSPAPEDILECIEKSQVKFAISKEEAERLCIEAEVTVEVKKEAIPVTTSPPVGPNIEDQQMKKCYALEDKLLALTEKIVTASPEERISLQRDMETVRMMLEECAEPVIEIKEAVIVSTSPPVHPCKEVERLKEELEEITEKGVLEYEKEMESIKEKLRKAEEACQHSIEGVSSLKDVEKIYLIRIEASIEGADDDKALMGELAKIEEEKKKLIEDFTAKIQELEFKKVRIIKKLRIGGGEVFLDNVKITVPKIKIEVEGVEVELKPMGEEVEIVEGGVAVRGKVKLEYSDDVLTAAKSGRPIKVLPSELKNIVKGEMGDVEIVDEDVPKYLVKSRENGKLLGVVSVTLDMETQVNAEDGKVISEDKPWWSFLVVK